MLCVPLTVCNISLCLCRVDGLSMKRSRLNVLIIIAHSKHFIMISYCFVW